MIEKSRVPIAESKRIDLKHNQLDSDVDNNQNEDNHQKSKVKSNKDFDMELYDDRPFYSLLLKVLVIHNIKIYSILYSLSS